MYQALPAAWEEACCYVNGLSFIKLLIKSLFLLLLLLFLFVWQAHISATGNGLLCKIFDVTIWESMEHVVNFYFCIQYVMFVVCLFVVVVAAYCWKHTNPMICNWIAH